MPRAPQNLFSTLSPPLGPYSAGPHWVRLLQYTGYALAPPPTCSALPLLTDAVEKVGVAHQAAGRDEHAIKGDHGHGVAERQGGERFAPAV